jgi:hypothetical protein
MKKEIPTQAKNGLEWGTHDLVFPQNKKRGLGGPRDYFLSISSIAIWEG